MVNRLLNNVCHYVLVLLFLYINSFNHKINNAKINFDIVHAPITNRIYCAKAITFLFIYQYSLNVLV